MDIDPQVELAIQAMLDTKCPECSAKRGDFCRGTEQYKFHPTRARRASTKQKMYLINNEETAA